MNYISFTFIVFLFGLLGAYVITPNRYKWIVLLGFSLIFYASYGIDKLIFMLGTSVIIYVAARCIQRIWQQFDEAASGETISTEEKKKLVKKYTRKSKHVLVAAMLICFGMMCWCKFGIQAIGWINHFTGKSLAMKILLPLGISYYTFSSVGYLIDIHWRTVEAEKSYPKLLLCMIYFPHVVEGPIPKYDRLLPQFDRLTFPDYDRFCKGTQLALWGLFKKMVIADRLGIFVNGVFSNVNSNWGMIYPIALTFAAFQLYADFSGCMDIITGISDIVGVKLDKNFDHPYLAKTVSEFWRRWHMSLFNWLKDYLYMPILTSRMMNSLRKAVKKRWGKDAAKMVVSILPTAGVFLLISFWHSLNMMSLVHAIYWTILIVLSSATEKGLARLSVRLKIDTKSNIWRCFQSVRTFSFYAFGFFTVSPSNFKDMVTAFIHMVSKLNPWIFWDGSLYSYGLDRANFRLAILSIIFLMIAEVFQERCNIRNEIAKCNIVVRWTVYFVGIFAVLIFGIYGPGYDAAAFLYQQF